MQTIITLRLENGEVGRRLWVTEWEGDYKSEIVRLFGGNTVPTPYTEKKLGLDVLKIIAEKNPNAIVRLAA